MTAFIGWQELMVVAAIPALIGGSVGVVLLVIGLVERRKGLWVGGLSVLIVSILLLASMAGFALLVSGGVSRPAPAVTRSVPPVIVQPPLFSDQAGEILGLPDGDLPEGTTLSEDLAGDAFDTRRVALTADGDFGPVLEEHFEKTTWEEVREHIIGKEPSVWRRDADDLKGLPCYLREFTADDGAKYTAHACYDRKGAKLYCTIKRVSPPIAAFERPPKFRPESPDEED